MKTIKKLKAMYEKDPSDPIVATEINVLEEMVELIDKLNKIFPKEQGLSTLKARIESK